MRVGCAQAVDVGARRRSGCIEVPGLVFSRHGLQVSAEA